MSRALKAYVISFCIGLGALGCGGARDFLQNVPKLGSSDTAAGVLAAWGQPCRSEGVPGMERWYYCAQRQPGIPPSWLLDAQCPPTCTEWWVVSITAGYVTGVEDPVP